MFSEDFLDSISPFWIFIKKDGKLHSTSKYFKPHVKEDEHITDSFLFKRVFIRDDGDIISSLKGKLFNLEFKKKQLIFRSLLHSEKDYALITMWPSLRNIEQISELGIQNEMSHPGAVIKELLISKDIIKRNSEIIKNIEVQAKEVRYKYLFEQSNDAVLTMAPPSWRFTSANKAALKLYELKNVEQFFELTFDKLSPPLQPCGSPSSELLKTYMDEAFATGGSSFPWEYLTAKKKLAPCLVTLSRIIEDEFTYLQVVVRDTSKEKELEKSLRDSNEYLELALSGAGLGIWDWDLTTNKVTFDRRWLEMLGLKEGEVEMSFETWESRVHPDDLKQALEDIEKYRKGQTKRYENIHRMRHASGSWIYILDKGRFSDWDSNGEPTRFTGTHLDITEKIETEKALMRNAKLASIGELAAGIGHEINNPLSIVRGYLNLLLKKEPKLPGDIVETLEKVNHASIRIQKIVAGLKNFSQIEKSTKENFFNVKNLFFEMENMLKAIYDAEGISLSFSYDQIHAGACIPGDRLKLEQILLNLFSNAKDATEGQSKRLITLSSQTTPSHVTISISDNGHGISNDLKGRVFDPFFTTKDIGKGTGIGLSLVHSFITKDFNGEIDILDSRFETGCTFFIKIPIEVIDYRDEGFDIKKPEPTRKFSIKAMLVDDEQGILELLKLQLEDMGIETSCFSDGEEAFKHYQQNPNTYDLILSDIKMPKLSGPELLKKIRHHKSIKRPKFIFMTGGMNDILEHNIDEDYDELIEKPFNEESFLKKLEGLFPDFKK